MARKYGVEHSAGKYILFVDVDDYYKENNAIEMMHKAIVEDDCQIVQFGHYEDRFWGMYLQKKTKTPKISLFFAKEMLGEQLTGAIINRGGFFDGAVWDKIYDKEIIKEAVSHIKQKMVFSDDLHLNLYAFTSSLVKHVSVHPEAYYVHILGVGITSKNESVSKRLSCNEIFKRDAFMACESLQGRYDGEYSKIEYLRLRLHSESLWAFRAFVFSLLEEKVYENEILQFIREGDATTHIQSAKKYFRMVEGDTDRVALDFMCSDYTPEGYLGWCKANLPKLTLKQQFVRFLKKVVYKSKKWF